MKITTIFIANIFIFNFFMTAQSCCCSGNLFKTSSFKENSCCSSQKSNTKHRKSEQHLPCSYNQDCQCTKISVYNFIENQPILIQQSASQEPIQFIENEIYSFLHEKKCPFQIKESFLLTMPKFPTNIPLRI